MVLDSSSGEELQLRRTKRSSIDASSQFRFKIITKGQRSISGSRKEVGTAEVTKKGEETGATLEDLDVLDCPICCEPLSPPVYQCGEGHLACSSCCKKIKKCPSCANSIDLIRCRAIERVVQSVKISCANKKYGCSEKLCHFKKLDHELKECRYAPVSCPCCEDYVATCSVLYLHFIGQHSSSAIPITFDSFIHFAVDKDVPKVVLQKSFQGILFVISSSIDPSGTLVNVTCVAPATSGAKFAYDLTVTKGHKTMNLTNLVELTPKLIAHPPEESCFLITKDFYCDSPSESCRLEALVRIRKLTS